MTGQLGAHTRRLIGAAILSLVVATTGSAAPEGEMLDVTIDFAKVLKFDRPFTDIIVGNTGIADVKERDQSSFVLMGKSAGTTNLIVLDDTGAEMANYIVRVSSDVQQLTTIFYGDSRQTFACAPICEQVVSVGDDPEKFTAATTQITGRQTFSAGQ